MSDDEYWSQEEIIHCPDLKCHGMLLSSPTHSEYKCSDCKRLWVSTLTWTDVSIKDTHSH